MKRDDWIMLGGIVIAILSSLLIGAKSCHAETVTMDVKWLRTYGLPEVRDNACYVAVPDDPAGVDYMSTHLRWCMRQGKPLASDNPPKGSHRIVWEEVPRARLVELWTKHNGPPRPKLAQNIDGMFVRVDDAWYIYTNEDVEHVVGHEYKHVEDGNFHYHPTVDIWGRMWPGKWKQP